MIPKTLAPAALAAFGSLLATVPGRTACPGSIFSAGGSREIVPRCWHSSLLPTVSLRAPALPGSWRCARRTSRALPEWLCVPSPPAQRLLGHPPAGALPQERELQSCAAAAGGLWRTRASVFRRRDSGYSAGSGVPASPYKCPALGNPGDLLPGARAVLAAPGVEPGGPGQRWGIVTAGS